MSEITISQNGPVPKKRPHNRYMALFKGEARDEAQIEPHSNLA